MVKCGAGPTRLSRQAWVQAALEALAEGGLAAVAVEPLAARLGATKGSFYWHFANRDALSSAALASGSAHTDAVIAEIEALGRPGPSFASSSDRVAALAARDRIELAARRGRPSDWCRRCSCASPGAGSSSPPSSSSGSASRRGERRALLAYSAYLGTRNSCHATPQLLPRARRQTRLPRRRSRRADLAAKPQLRPAAPAEPPVERSTASRARYAKGAVSGAFRSSGGGI